MFSPTLFLRIKFNWTILTLTSFCHNTIACRMCWTWWKMISLSLSKVQAMNLRQCNKFLRFTFDFPFPRSFQIEKCYACGQFFFHFRSGQYRQIKTEKLIQCQTKNEENLIENLPNHAQSSNYKYTKRKSKLILPNGIAFLMETFLLNWKTLNNSPFASFTWSSPWELMHTMPSSLCKLWRWNKQITIRKKSVWSSLIYLKSFHIEVKQHLRFTYWIEFLFHWLFHYNPIEHVLPHSVNPHSIIH